MKVATEVFEPAVFFALVKYIEAVAVTGTDAVIAKLERGKAL